MATIAAARDGLKARLATISDLRVYDNVLGQVEPPAAVIRLDTIQYDTTMADGSHDPTFIVLVLVSLANERTAQDKLDSYLEPESATSIRNAIDADPTLGGAVDYATATQVRAYGLVNYADVGYLGAEVVVSTGIQ
jgi:hypothetical protein